MSPARCVVGTAENDNSVRRGRGAPLSFRARFRVASSPPSRQFGRSPPASACVLRPLRRPRPPARLPRRRSAGMTTAPLSCPPLLRLSSSAWLTVYSGPCLHDASAAAAPAPSFAGVPCGLCVRVLRLCGPLRLPAVARNGRRGPPRARTKAARSPCDLPPRKSFYRAGCALPDDVIDLPYDNDTGNTTSQTCEAALFQRLTGCPIRYEASTYGIGRAVSHPFVWAERNVEDVTCSHTIRAIAAISHCGKSARVVVVRRCR